MFTHCFLLIQLGFFFLQTQVVVFILWYFGHYYKVHKFIVNCIDHNEFVRTESEPSDLWWISDQVRKSRKSGQLLFLRINLSYDHFWTSLLVHNWFSWTSLWVKSCCTEEDLRTSSRRIMGALPPPLKDIHRCAFRGEGGSAVARLSRTWTPTDT